MVSLLFAILFANYATFVELVCSPISTASVPLEQLNGTRWHVQRMQPGPPNEINACYSISFDVDSTGTSGTVTILTFFPGYPPVQQEVPKIPIVQKDPNSGTIYVDSGNNAQFMPEKKIQVLHFNEGYSLVMNFCSEGPNDAESLLITTANKMESNIQINNIIKSLPKDIKIDELSVINQQGCNN